MDGWKINYITLFVAADNKKTKSILRVSQAVYVCAWYGQQVDIVSPQGQSIGPVCG